MIHTIRASQGSVNLILSQGFWNGSQTSDEDPFEIQQNELLHKILMKGIGYQSYEQICWQNTAKRSHRKV